MINFLVNQKIGKGIKNCFWRQWFKKIEKSLKIKKRLELSVGLVGRSEMKKLNLIYRKINKVTDVLSFGEKDSRDKFNFGDDSYLGEIIICLPQAQIQARQAGQALEKELQLLVTHGFLHLLGYNHEKPKESEVMRQLESKILSIKS
ncbi:MAG: rRNA maturation RNase YbeY [Candidatus Buchananbacteria bacterium]|jgi:probable rRNA maturation factor